MIKKELHFVWITKDGKKFLDRDEAEKHNDLLIDPRDIVDQWLDKLKDNPHPSQFSTLDKLKGEK